MPLWRGVHVYLPVYKVPTGGPWKEVLSTSRLIRGEGQSAATSYIGILNISDLKPSELAKVVSCSYLSMKSQ